MNLQTVLLVDNRDKVLGHASWTDGHFGHGKQHRGFVTLLFDDKGYVYLQKRKHRVFDGLWDLTAISHPYENGDKEEGLIEAANRALRVEMGIGKTELKNVGAFTYFAKDGEWCENEYCYILTGNFNGQFKPNKKLVYGARKVRFEDFIKDISKNPGKYTPWAKLSISILKEHFRVQNLL